MGGKLRLCLLFVAICSSWVAEAFSTRDPDCESMIDPFEDQTFSGVNLADCKKKCLESYYFHCESILFSPKGNQCILSGEKRDEPELACVDNSKQYQYYERPEECGKEDLTNKITSCSASNTQAGFECRNVYDGSVQDSSAAGSAWAVAYGKGVGEEMRVNLNEDYTLTAVHILPRCYKLAQVAAWKLEFEDGEQHVVESRACGGTGSWTDCSGHGNDWMEIKLPKPVLTSFVKMQIVKTCGVYYVGMREVKLLGYDN